MSILGSLFNIGQRRQPSGWLSWAIPPYAAMIGVGVIYASQFATIHPWTLAMLFLCAMYALIFLFVGAFSTSNPVRPAVIDWVLMLLSLVIGIYMFVEADRFAERIPQIDTLSDMDKILGVAFVALSIEVTRRTTGLGLALIVLLFLSYNIFGHRISGVLGHGYLDLEVMLDSLVYTTSGILGVPARVAASFAYLFILFGVFLGKSGGSDFFFNLAASISGRRTGGPAKIAVISSGLYGMVSGSSVSDVVTTGSITIPMMRKLGYPRVLAGAVEVSASTGGSLLPPVMGAAAFVMVEYTGQSYKTIAIAALVPALLYYVSIYMQVHFRSRKLGLKGMEESEIPGFWHSIKEGGLFIIPMVVLTTSLLIGFSPAFVAVVGSLSIIAVATLRKSTRLSARDIYKCLSEATLRMVVVTGAVAAAGLVIGGITMTGLAQKFSHLVQQITDGQLFSSLLIAAALTIILGLGMPTVSAYILAAILIGPLLSELGVPILAAHMFLLYFAVMSAITPPVAVAAYVAAAIAEDNPLRIAITAVRLSMAAFIVPFAFIYRNELLLIGQPLDIAYAVLVVTIGVVALAIAVEGYLNKLLLGWQRIVIGAGGITLMVPGLTATILGTALIALVPASQFLAGRLKARDTQKPSS